MTTVPATDTPASNLRNSLILLGGLRALLTTDSQRELLESASQRVWRAIQQIEGK